MNSPKRSEAATGKGNDLENLTAQSKDTIKPNVIIENLFGEPRTISEVGVLSGFTQRRVRYVVKQRIRWGLCLKLSKGRYYIDMYACQGKVVWDGK